MAAKGSIKASANMQARIKRMMQSDEDVGKVAKASPVLIAKAMEVFLHSMVEGAAAIAEGRGARMLTASHIKAHIEGELLLDFLKEAVAAVPDLPPAGAEKPKPKRQRAKSEGDESGTPKVRGRSGRGRGARGGRGGRGRGRKGASADEEAAAAAEGEGELGAALMDVDCAGTTEEQATAGGSPGSGSCPVAASPQQQQQQQQAADEQQQDGGGQEQAEGDAAAPAALEEQDGRQGGEDEAAAALPPAVSIPGFLAAGVAMAGAEAEEEDYDE